MSGLHPILLAAIVAVAGISLSAIYLLVYARRSARQRAGISAMADLKWREFSHLVLEALRRDGWVEEDIERQPGDSGFDFVLARNGEAALLSCKHGRTFRLSESNVRDFATAVRMHGVHGGIIATLGSIEGFAREVAEANQIQVLDGNQLWERVSPLMPGTIIGDIQHHTAQEANRRLSIAAAASLTLAAVVFLAAAGTWAPDRDDVRSNRLDAAAPALPVPQPAPPGRTGALAADTNGLAGDLDAATLAERRERATRHVATLPALAEVGWSTRSTLVLGLAEHDTRNEVIEPLVEEACRLLVQYEELRYTRLQLEPPHGVDAPVRWRQCR